MLIRVEALLESLAQAGSSVDLATQQAFAQLRSRTLKQEQVAFDQARALPHRHHPHPRRTSVL
jgi:hypothetical protein